MVPTNGFSPFSSILLSQPDSSQSTTDSNNFDHDPSKLTNLALQTLSASAQQSDAGRAFDPGQVHLWNTSVSEALSNLDQTAIPSPLQPFSQTNSCAFALSSQTPPSSLEEIQAQLNPILEDLLSNSQPRKRICTQSTYSSATAPPPNEDETEASALDIQSEEAEQAFDTSCLPNPIPRGRGKKRPHSDLTSPPATTQTFSSSSSSSIAEPQGLPIINIDTSRTRGKGTTYINKRQSFLTQFFKDSQLTDLELTALLKGMKVFHFPRKKDDLPVTVKSVRTVLEQVQGSDESIKTLYVELEEDPIQREIFEFFIPLQEGEFYVLRRNLYGYSSPAPRNQFDLVLFEKTKETSIFSPERNHSHSLIHDQFRLYDLDLNQKTCRMAPNSEHRMSAAQLLPSRLLYCLPVPKDPHNNTLPNMEVLQNMQTTLDKSGIKFGTKELSNLIELNAADSQSQSSSSSSSSLIDNNSQTSSSSSSISASDQRSLNLYHLQGQTNFVNTFRFSSNVDTIKWNNIIASQSTFTHFGTQTKFQLETVQNIDGNYYLNPKGNLPPISALECFSSNIRTNGFFLLWNNVSNLFDLVKVKTVNPDSYVFEHWTMQNPSNPIQADCWAPSGQEQTILKNDLSRLHALACIRLYSESGSRNPFDLKKLKKIQDELNKSGIQFSEQNVFQPSFSPSSGISPLTLTLEQTPADAAYQKLKSKLLPIFIKAPNPLTDSDWKQICDPDLPIHLPSVNASLTVQNVLVENNTIYAITEQGKKEIFHYYPVLKKDEFYLLRHAKRNKFALVTFKEIRQRTKISGDQTRHRYQYLQFENWKKTESGTWEPLNTIYETLAEFGRMQARLLACIPVKLANLDTVLGVLNKINFPFENNGHPERRLSQEQS